MSIFQNGRPLEENIPHSVKANQSPKDGERQPNGTSDVDQFFYYADLKTFSESLYQEAKNNLWTQTKLKGVIQNLMQAYLDDLTNNRKVHEAKGVEYTDEGQIKCTRCWDTLNADAYNVSKTRFDGKPICLVACGD